MIVNHHELERVVRTVEASEEAASEGAGEASEGSVVASEEGVEGQEWSPIEKVGEAMASLGTPDTLSRM